MCLQAAKARFNDLSKQNCKNETKQKFIKVQNNGWFQFRHVRKREEKNDCDLCLEIKESWFETGCYLRAEMSSLQQSPG